MEDGHIEILNRLERLKWFASEIAHDYEIVFLIQDEINNILDNYEVIDLDDEQEN